MKTYQTPILVAKGDLVTLTLGPVNGADDPIGTTLLSSVGSVGFGL